MPRTLCCNFANTLSILDFLDIIICRFFTRRRLNRSNPTVLHAQRIKRVLWHLSTQRGRKYGSRVPISVEAPTSASQQEWIRSCGQFAPTNSINFRFLPVKQHHTVHAPFKAIGRFVGARRVAVTSVSDGKLIRYRASGMLGDQGRQAEVLSGDLGLGADRPGGRKQDRQADLAVLQVCFGMYFAVP